MEKYSNDWYEDLMKSRGYNRMNGQPNVWSKLIGEISNIGDISNEDSFWIFATIDKDDNTIEISSNTLKMLMIISSGQLRIDHPDFVRFEKKLIDYIDACLQHDYVEKAVKQRQLDRDIKTIK